MSLEVSIMPKELRDAPETEVPVKCPCCKEDFIFKVRIAGTQLCVGIISAKAQTTQKLILHAINSKT